MSQQAEMSRASPTAATAANGRADGTAREHGTLSTAANTAAHALLAREGEWRVPDNECITTTHTKILEWEMREQGKQLTDEDNNNNAKSKKRVPDKTIMRQAHL